VFDPVRSYDKPGVILAQLANGIATTDSVRRVLFDPAALSPRERESFADRMKKEHGGNPVADTAIDVLANPVVWLGVLCAVGGGVAANNLAKGNRFFAAPSGAGAYAKQMFPWLRQLHLTSGMSESIGKRIAPLAQVGITHMEEVRGELGRVMQDEVAQVLRQVSAQHGVEVTRLDPESAPNEAVAHSLRQIRSVMAARRLGWDRDRTETVAAGVEPERYHIRVTHQPGNTGKARTREMEVEKELHDALMDKFKRVRTGAYGQVLDRAKNKTLLKSMPGFKAEETMYESMERLGLDHVTFRMGLAGKKVRPQMDPTGASLDAASLLEGGVRTKWEEVERKKLVGDDAALRAVETRFNLRGLQDAERKLYETGRVKLAGDEDHYRRTGQFQIDDKKILRLARAQLQTLANAGYMTEGGRVEVGGEEAVRALLSDEVSSQLMMAAEQRTGKKIKVGATAKEIEQVVIDAYKKGFEDPFYMPRNTTEARDAQGRKIQYNPYTGRAQGKDGSENPTVSGRTMMRSRTTALPWDPEDLEFLATHFGGTTELHSLIRHARERVQGQIAEENMYRVMRIAPDVAASKYVATTARDYAMFAMDAAADPHIKAILKDYGPGASPVRLPGPLGRIQGGGALVGSRELEGVPDEMRALGGYSLWDMMHADLQAQAVASPEDKYAVDLWRKHIIPATLGIKGQDEAAHLAAASQMREAALRFSNSGFMKAVERTGSYPARFVQELRAWGADPMGDATLPWQAVTKTLYASHLGLNIGSALINMLQPIQSLHHLGFSNTVKAYSQSLEMIGQYTAERAKLGMGATREQIEAARTRAFSRAFGGRAADLTKIAELGSSWDMVERAGYGVSHSVGKPQFSVLEAMMKPFQVAETLNRVATANAVFNAYEKAGKTVGMNFERASQEASTAVQAFQFGSSPINRPALFYKDFAKQPLFRQFAQYGLKSFANLFTMPVMMGGTRNIGPVEVSGKLPITLVDLTKMAAVSAVVYEVGKSMLGVDLSRGLAFGGPTDMVGGQQAFNNKNFPMYVPPVLDIGWDVARYLATGDQDILQDWAPRVIPGGVAISRALGAAPQSETLGALGLQKTYADWSQSDSGMVPMYGGDGRYMGQYPTSDVVLRAFGADLGRFNNPQELSQFLMKNRDGMRDMRRQFISATLGNNMSAAQKVKVQFEKRFGMPLTVTQAQFKDAIRTREESVVMRTMNTIDNGLRGQYIGAVQQYLPGQLQRAPSVPTEQGAQYIWGNNR
jgi:hypothetical protein